MPSLRILPLLLLFPTVLLAQGPSYARQVQPIFARYCAGCHSGWGAKAGFRTGTVASLKGGGKTGPAFVAGDDNKSLLVQRLLAQGDKQMPPAGARQPLPEEIEILRAWIAAGGRDDTDTARSLPEIPPATPAPVPVAAVAYSPDGKVLVAGAGDALVVLDPDKGITRSRITGLDGRITALAFRPDGKVLAVASGR